MSSRIRRSVAALGAFTVALALAAPSHAYVRSVTEKGTPVFWPGGCTWIFPDSAGTPDLAFDVVVATLGKSIANWQSVTLDAGCSYLGIHQDPPAPSEAHLDRINVLKFRTDEWCRPGETNNPRVCYSSSAAAITTVFYTSNPGKPDDGAIIDADIQMNNINFNFVVVGADGKVPDGGAGFQVADLENTLTHELGHFQGLDHTCWDMAPPHESSAPIDDTGTPIPSCADVSARRVPIKDWVRITEATMYNFAMPGETIKRSPSADDIAGICGIYPVAKSPNSCERPKAPDSGCTITAARPDGSSREPIAFALVGFGLIGLLLRRRRRASR